MDKNIEIIGKIANRAVAINPAYDKTTVTMDLLVLYETGVEMRWEEFLNAPVFDFMHDINGINQHIEKNTVNRSNNLVSLDEGNIK